MTKITCSSSLALLANEVGYDPIEDRLRQNIRATMEALLRYQRLTKKAEALIASVYLAGTNTRRVKRALYGLFRGAVGKDVVAPAWRQGEGRLGRVVRPPIWPTKISSVSVWTAPSSRPDATARPRTSRCWRPSVCAGMAIRFCYPS